MARRVVAALAAVALIVAGIAIRNQKENEPRRNLPAAKVNPYEVFDKTDNVSVVCAVELAAVCERLASYVRTTTVEPTWATVDRLAGGGVLGADAWLTFRPLEEMAAPPAPAQSTLAPATLVGRSPVVLAGPPAAVAAVKAACPDPRVLLSCAGSVAGVQLMLRDPASSAVGGIALSVPAEELGVAAPAPALDKGAASLAGLLARSRLTPVPYEDVSRLQGGAVALTLEADVNLFLRRLPFEEQQNYDRVALLYPFEARAAEVVAVPARAFPRAADLVSLITSTTVGSVLERSGYEAPGTTPSLFPRKLYAERPTIRGDLPPPSPARLRQLRDLPKTAGSPGISP